MWASQDEQCSVLARCGSQAENRCHHDRALVAVFFWYFYYCALAKGPFPPIPFPLPLMARDSPNGKLVNFPINSHTPLVPCVWKGDSWKEQLACPCCHWNPWQSSHRSELRKDWALITVVHIASYSVGFLPLTECSRAVVWSDRVYIKSASLQTPHPSSKEFTHSLGFLLGTIQPCCFDFVIGQTPSPSRINKIAWLMICELGLDTIYCRNSSLRDFVTC